MDFIRKNYLTISTMILMVTIIFFMAFSAINLILDKNMELKLEIFFVLALVFLFSFFSFIIVRFIIIMNNSKNYLLNFYNNTNVDAELNYNIFIIELNIWLFIIVNYIGLYLLLQNDEYISSIGFIILFMYYLYIIIHISIILFKKKNQVKNSGQNENLENV